MTSTDPLLEQSRQNRTTRGQWELFAPHRQKLEQLMLPGHGGRLCVLGAGNCNDLDLHWAQKTFAQVHLVDLDPDALRQAMERQHVQASATLHLHAPVNLTAADFHPGQFDVVLSPCVLSQLIEPVRKLLSKDLVQLLPKVKELRANHLALMARLLAQNGLGIVAIDITSSDVVKELAHIPDDQLADAMRNVIGQGRSFVGLDPRSLKQAIEAHPDLASITITQPWRWHIGLLRSFIVYAMCFRRRPEVTPPDRDLLLR